MKLGLDMALHTGWAIEDNGTIAASGVWDFTKTRSKEGQHYGHLFFALENALAAVSVRSELTAIRIERAHFRAGSPTRIGVGMMAVAAMFCATHNLAFLDVHSLTLKKWATGSGKAKKSDMIEAAYKLSGIRTTSDDEADAVLIALYKEVKDDKQKT